jgi:roadblock/LC7 domain-containing protein
VSAALSGGIFISYRRQESSHLAGRLYDRLAERFGAERVFMDVATIDLGVDFAAVITRAVGTCQVLLAVIGPQWVTVADADGRRRLKDPNDFVRLEIQAALERDVRVIPILVEGAPMPRLRDLPRPLAGLARRNALTMRHESFPYDAERLLEAIERVLADPTPAVTEVVSDPPLVRSFHLGREVTGVAFSPDGRLLATGSADQTARIWEAATGQERTRFSHDEGVAVVAFSPDGRMLATGSFDPNARIWDAASGQMTTRVAHDGMVPGVAFGFGGRLLATGSADRTARVWDAASGREQIWMSHDAPVAAVAFSPDGRLLATASEDQTARVWDAASGQEQVWMSHAAPVWAVAFSPDGRLLATASEDQSARVWDAASGQERARIRHHAAVAAIAFSPDGRLLATGGFDDAAWIWTLLR